MDVAPVDLTELVAIIMGVSIVLVPVIGLTARFALKPTVEALSKFFESKGAEETTKILERRVSLLEHQVEHMESTVRHLEEVSDFETRLDEGRDASPALGKATED